jgi:hypothetical protein
VQVSGDAPPFVHEIDPLEGVVTTVHVDAAVKSYVVAPEVPCATKVCVGVLFAAAAFQVSGLPQVVDPNVPVHSVKLVTVPRYTVAEAVPLRPCAEAVIVALPPVPWPVATPVLELIVSTVLSLLVHTTPLVIWLVPVLFA